MSVLKQELECQESDGQPADETEEELQQRLHDSAMRFVGTIKGGDPYLAENARSEVKARIRARIRGER